MIPLRDENPTQTFSYMTVFLIVLNFLVFFYEVYLGGLLEVAIRPYTLIPYNFINYFGFDQLITLITCMFFHGSLFHLLGNMLYLWIFGNNVEDVLGHFRFLLYYLLCGIFASLVHIFTNPSSTIPTIGASGAISGVLGAYFVLFPQARIVTLVPIFYFIRIIRIPAFYFLGLWVFFQIISGLLSLGSSFEEGIAWFAHVGGFFAGVLLLPIFCGFRRRYEV